MRARGCLVVCGLTAAVLVTRTAGAEVPREPEPGAPRVHVDAPYPADVLFKVPTPDERTRLGPLYRDRGIPVCFTPCDTVVDARDGSYFYIGTWKEGGPVTERFPLRYASGDVVGRPSLRTAGLATMIAGAVTTAIGGALSSGMWLAMWSPGSGLGHDSFEAGLYSGYALLGAGALVLIAGAGVFQASKTKVEHIFAPSVPLGGSARLEAGVLRF